MTFKHELKRKLAHLTWFLIALAYVLLHHAYGRTALLLPLILFLTFLTADILRLCFHVKLPLLSLLRKKEQNKLFAPTTTSFGILLALFLFPHDIAITSVFMMALGDTAAALIGIKYGKHPLPFRNDKAWEGALAELVVNLAVGFTLLTNTITILVMALTATLVETYNKRWDDNMLIPLAASLAGYLLRTYLITT